MESSKANVTHMKGMPTNQPQTQVNQLRNHKINFNKYNKKAKEEIFLPLTGQSYNTTSYHKPGPLSNLYKLMPAHSAKSRTGT